MPEFAYQGQSAKGNAHGTIEAATAGEAASLLRSRGVTPITIKPIAAKRKAASMPASAPSAPGGAGLFGSRQAGFKLIGPHVRREDLLLLSRQLHVLMKAGVPITAGLASLRDSSSNEALRAVLSELLTSLQAGVNLSTSFSHHPKVFDAFYRSMVRVGEETGRLEEVFLALFRHLEFEGHMRQQVRTALRYPSFVVITIALALVVVNVFVIPTFATIFKGLNAELPLFTRFLIGTSDFMLHYGWLLLLALMGAGFGFVSWVKTAAGRLRWHALLLRLPVVGPIVLKAALARFTRSFALSLKSGVPTVQAISIVAETADNAYLSMRLAGMRESIERGESVLRAARSSDVFPPMVLQMIAVGEESGAMDEMMDEVSQMYSNEVQYELKTLAQRIEPILIFAIGVLILVLALGIFLPMWDLGSAALQK